MAKIGRITYPSTGRIGKLSELFGILAGSVDAALPVKFVPTLAALNAIGMTEATPAGTIATLSANNGGLAGGATFVLGDDGRWELSGACTALNVDTFVTTIASLPNVYCMAGAQAWNMATASLAVFTSAAGLYQTQTLSQMKHGSGTAAAAIAVGGTFTAAITFPPQTFAAEPKNIIVTTDSSRLTCAAVTRTKDGFTLTLSNWSNGASPTNVKYYWTAIA